jgi:hypothetical protein
MKTTFARKAAFGCALLSSTANCGLTAAPAQAQAQASTNIAPPAEKFAVAPGGVDMRTGRYAYNQTDLSIGGETGGLSLARSMVQQVAGHNNPFANFSHNMDVLVSEKRINIANGDFRHSASNPNFQIEINFGGRSQTFRTYGAPGAFEQTSSSGWARLTYSGGTDLAGSAIQYTYQTGDGTTATFRPMGSNDCSSIMRCAYVSQIVEADGTRLDFEYDNSGSNSTRLRSVTSNRGYALLFEYGDGVVTKACVLNLTQQVKPASNVCPAGAQATATYAYDSAAGAARLATATDAGGGVWSFVNAPGSIGFVKPGQQSPWLTNLTQDRMNDDYQVEEIVTQQNFADGTSYHYNYDYTPDVEGHEPSIAGGTYTDNQGRKTTVAYAFPLRPHASQGYGNVGGGGIGEPSSPLVYQTTSGPASVTDPLNRTTLTDYCDPNAMANLPAYEINRCIVMPVPFTVTDPEGIVTKMTWNVQLRLLIESRQIAKSGSGLADIVRSAGYDCSLPNFRYCAKPVWVTDAKGNTSNYTYDPAHGGVLTEPARRRPRAHRARRNAMSMSPARRG